MIARTETSGAMMHVEIQPTADDRATDFTAVDGNTGEHYSGYTLMVVAYALIWVILMGWLLRIWQHTSNLTQRVAGLESAIERAERKVAGTKAKAKEAKPLESEKPRRDDVPEKETSS
jgi:hypothetical protein